MIERRRAPGSSRVTLRTIVTEITSHVIGICRSLEIWRMTLIAICVCQLVVPVGMARYTGSRHVRPRQWERSGSMIER